MRDSLFTSQSPRVLVGSPPTVSSYGFRPLRAQVLYPTRPSRPPHGTPPRCPQRTRLAGGGASSLLMVMPVNLKTSVKVLGVSLCTLQLCTRHAIGDATRHGSSGVIDMYCIVMGGRCPAGGVLREASRAGVPAWLCRLPHALFRVSALVSLMAPRSWGKSVVSHPCASCASTWRYTQCGRWPGI